MTTMNKRMKAEVQKLIDMPLEDFCKFVEEEIVKVPTIQSGVDLIYPFDLRGSLDMKSAHCKGLHKWTAFLNNAGTLCHVVSAEAQIMVRVKFNYPISHLSANRMLESIKARIQNWVII